MVVSCVAKAMIKLATAQRRVIAIGVEFYEGVLWVRSKGRIGPGIYGAARLGD